MKCLLILLLAALCISCNGLKIDQPQIHLDTDHHEQQQNQNHHHHPHHKLHSSETKDKQNCDAVVDYFESINIQISRHNNDVGPICGGHCCDNRTELELEAKSSHNFRDIFRHYTKRLTGTLKTTASTYRDHVINISKYYEKKIKSLFVQVYRPFALEHFQSIELVFEGIRKKLTENENIDLDSVVHNFFMTFLPTAYHHALNSSSTTNDLTMDYKECLKNKYKELKPFGDVPDTLAKSVVYSVGAATIFTYALERSADVMASTEILDLNYTTTKCRVQLLRMYECPQCNGLTKVKVKPCAAYCLNVLRGCLAQYVGVLDSPWTNVAVAIEKLWHESVKTGKGLEEVLKSFETEVSQAIMLLMENTLTLDKKVKKLCGNPTLVPIDMAQMELNWKNSIPTPYRISPPNAEMLNLLVSIDKSKEFYSNIVDGMCNNSDEYKTDDRNCWTGNRISDYTNGIMSTGVDAQRYNPEVPLESHTYSHTKLDDIVDKLIKLKQMITTAMSTYVTESSFSDVQSDMARLNEGSGWTGDDEDIDDLNREDEINYGSGDGSGDGSHYSRDFDPKDTNTSSGGVQVTEAKPPAPKDSAVSLAIPAFSMIMCITSTRIMASYF